MAIRFYNTLSHGLEDFLPVDPPKVYIYNCGPTVYDFAHIGNFRAFVFADLLRRFLEFAEHDVQQVMNITDVGHMTEDQLADGGGQDKMHVAVERVKTAKKSGKLPDNAVTDPSDPYQVARYYAGAFVDDAKLLGLKIADEAADHMPRATDHIPAMQDLIGKLIENDHAYLAADGAVYYSVQSFPDYGRLSGNTLERLRAGAGGRVQGEHQAVKRHPADFLLWKPDPHHLMKWDSPWGAGYPGWHIECSAMAMKLLGRSTIDIHTGGEDNIFPHHECEIAQSTAATGQPFARFWMHTRFLLVDGQKMSKSKGNFYTVREILAGKLTGSPVDPRVLRYELLKAHYRSNLNLSAKSIEESAIQVQRLRVTAGALRKKLAALDAPAAVEVDPAHPALAAFAEALSDDLNIGGALGVVFDWLGRHDREGPAQALAVIERLDSVLAVLDSDTEQGGEGDATAKCRAIDAARDAKDFETADRLRDELRDAGYVVLNTASGTVVERRLTSPS